MKKQDRQYQSESRRHALLPDKELLRRFLVYHPLSGKVYWRINRGRAKQGDEARNVHNAGYLYVRFFGKVIYLHRLAWLLMTDNDPKDFEIDHINGAKDDNRWSNLRLSTHAGNNRNVRRQRNNTSGVKGVYWHKQAKRWCAQISVGRKNNYIGLFCNLDAAAEAVRELRQSLHKEFTNHG